MLKLHDLSLESLFKLNASIITAKSFFIQVRESDAKFIVNLRQEDKGLYLRKGAENIYDQISYIKKYEQRFKSGDEICPKLSE